MAPKDRNNDKLSAFEPIKKRSVPQEIIGQLRDLLASGRLDPGSPLPSERELARRLQVSRPSLREALKALNLMGVLENRPGKGTRLADSSEAWLQDARLVQRQLFSRIASFSSQLTPKNRALANYVIRNYQQVVFMTARELAQACGVSEATVIRFVTRLGFSGYPDFLEAFRDVINARLTLSDRISIQESRDTQNGPLYRRVILSELNDVQDLLDNFDEPSFNRVVELLFRSPRVDVVGVRLSHAWAHYLAWALQRIRGGVRLLDGNQETILEHLALTQPPGLLVAVTVARYPRSLVNLARRAKDLGYTIVALTDNLVSPIIKLADAYLVAPSGRFALIGNLAALTCLVNCLVMAVAHQDTSLTKAHQAKLENFYRQHNIFIYPDMFKVNGQGTLGLEEAEPEPPDRPAAGR